MDLLFLIFISWILLGLFFPFLVNRYSPTLLHSVRFLAIYITVFCSGLSVIIWLAIAESGILFLGLAASLWGGINFLMTPKWYPQVRDKFNLRW